MQRNVLEYLEETVKRVPDKIAFANDKTQLTFQQFSDDIRAIGSELIRKGYQKEPVLIYMNKSPEALEGFFGGRHGCMDRKRCACRCDYRRS